MRIKIGWQHYRVIFVPSLKVDNGETELYGHQLGGNGLLKVSKKFGRRRAQTCLIHELLHAIDEQYRIDLKEKHVETLANGIMTVILDNPEMVNDFIKWVQK